MHHLNVYSILSPLLCALGVFSAQAAGSNDASVLMKEAAKANNQSLLWGPYKPNLYFGVQPRIPNSLSAGLMWGNVGGYATLQDSKYSISTSYKSRNTLIPYPDFRHTCEQNEGMAGYGWDEYDIRKGGRQTIHDAGNNIDITIDFVKVPGGQHGGNWGARVKGVPRDDAPAEQLTTMVFYTTLEGLGNMGVDTEADPLGFEGDVKFTGNTPDLGDFSIDVTAGPQTNGHPFHSHPTYEEKPLDRTLVSSDFFPQDNLWQSKGWSYVDGDWEFANANLYSDIVFAAEERGRRIYQAVWYREPTSSSTGFYHQECTR